jgi:hypothetical protein
VPSEAVDHLPEPAVELWRKVLPLGLIFFAASFNLTVLQSLKDSVVVVAGGAETLVRGAGGRGLCWCLEQGTGACMLACFLLF